MESYHERRYPLFAGSRRRRNPFRIISSPICYDSVESRLFLELTSDKLYLLACHFDTNNIGAPPSYTSSSTHGIGLLEPEYQEPMFQVIRPERKYLLEKAPYLVKITHGRFTTFGHNPYDKCDKRRSVNVPINSKMLF